jgi:hypothetical protein
MRPSQAKRSFEPQPPSTYPLPWDPGIEPPNGCVKNPNKSKMIQSKRKDLYKRSRFSCREENHPSSFHHHHPLSSPSSLSVYRTASFSLSPTQPVTPPLQKQIIYIYIYISLLFLSENAVQLPHHHHNRPLGHLHRRRDSLRKPRPNRTQQVRSELLASQQQRLEERAQLQGKELLVCSEWTSNLLRK